jgi:hypothetical protein
MRAIVVSVLIAAFLSGMPLVVHADQYHHGLGAYDEYHESHSGGWWLENHPNRVRAHHPEWARNGDRDAHRRGRDRDRRNQHRAGWKHERHHDWL